MSSYATKPGETQPDFDKVACTIGENQLYRHAMMEIERALRWAAAGLHVFPVRIATKNGKPTKVPRWSGWPDRATTDDIEIIDWWSQHPDDLVGWCLGKDGYCAIDLDTKSGPAEEEWSALCGYEPPNTWSQTTMSGGKHIVFRGELRNSVKELAPNIDTRGGAGGKHGYIIAYSDIPPQQVAELPDWISAALPTHERVETPTVSDVDLPINIARARERLLYAEPAIEGQGGDNHTYALAAELTRDLGISAATATRLMLDHWNQRCIPPWPAQDLAQIVDHAARYGQNAVGAHAAVGDWSDPGRSPFKSWKEIKNKTYQKPSWIWEGRVLANHANIWTGDGGHGKTTLALNLAVAVAAGAPLLGAPTRRLPVIVLVAEDAEGIVRDHCAQIATDLGVSDRLDDWLYVRSVLSDPVEDGHTLARIDDEGNCTTTSWNDEIERFIGETGECLVIIDPLVEFVRFNHLSDEACRSLVMQFLSRYTRLGATVLVTDHISKAGMRDGHGYGGSIQLKAAFPVLATLKAGEWSAGVVKQRPLTLRIIKNRYGREQDIEFWRLGDSPAFSLDQSPEIERHAERVYSHIAERLETGLDCDRTDSGAYGPGAMAYALEMTIDDVEHAIRYCREKAWLLVKKEKGRECFTLGPVTPTARFRSVVSF
jgi:hypothetical protein